jgi:sarcosine oxidase
VAGRCACGAAAAPCRCDAVFFRFTACTGFIIEMSGDSYDFVVIGAGCFGAWTAHALQRAGHKVLLLDASGPAHSRASSGGESRVIRMGYGADELYTRWSQRSLEQWKGLGERLQRPLFRQTGMLWMTGADDAYARATLQTLARVGIEHERLGPREVGDKFPQISTDGIAWAIWEPGSGALMARQAVQALVTECMRQGLDYRTHAVQPPEPAGATSSRAAGTEAVSASAERAKLGNIRTTAGECIYAGHFIFACGPWLPKLFPDLLGERIFPTRQEIFFFAPPPGDTSFAPPAMPCWFHHPALVYGIPDLETRGFKISVDKHGPAFDPDTGSRLPTADALTTAREYLALRFPKLRDAPLTESRVCQYENTSNGDFVIDRHPQFDDVTIVGGGSGHGFKHGPAVGDYVRRLLTTSAAAEPRFALATKAVVHKRSVY